MIRISGVVLRDDDGRLLTVRKRGTGRFILPGGKYEPGESAEQAAVRECREELGLALDPAGLVLLGRFRAAAANEAEHLVESTVFTHPARFDGRAAAEIEELRWLDPERPLPEDLAPLLADRIVPALRG